MTRLALEHDPDALHDRLDDPFLLVAACCTRARRDGGWCSRRWTAPLSVAAWHFEDLIF
jgi:hypothetical protein